MTIPTGGGITPTTGRPDTGATGWDGTIPTAYIMEMVDLEADRQSGKKLPVIWDSYIGGLLTSSESLNLQRTVDAVEQAFDQSPYLKK